MTLGVAGSIQNDADLWDNKTKGFAVYAIEKAPDPENFDLSDFVYKKYNEDTELRWATSSRNTQRLNFEANANYERTLRNHEISGLLMYHIDRYETSDNHYKFSNAGFGLRAHYGYQSRYFAEFTAGYYGEEQYKKGHRFGFSCSIFAFIISKENFLKDVKAINYLKVKVYGMVEEKILQDRL